MLDTFPLQYWAREEAAARCNVSVDDVSSAQSDEMKLNYSNHKETSACFLLQVVEHSIDGLCARKQKCDKACRIESS